MASQCLQFVSIIFPVGRKSNAHQYLGSSVSPGSLYAQVGHDLDSGLLRHRFSCLAILDLLVIAFRPQPKEQAHALRNSGTVGLLFLARFARSRISRRVKVLRNILHRGSAHLAQRSVENHVAYLTHYLAPHLAMRRAVRKSMVSSKDSLANDFLRRPE